MEKTYQELAARTLNGDPAHTPLERLANMLWGLDEEATELHHAIKIQNTAKIVEEAGDLRWYIAGVHSCLELNEVVTDPGSEYVGYISSVENSYEKLFLRLYDSIGELQGLCKKRYFHKKEFSDGVLVYWITEVRVAFEAILNIAGIGLSEVETSNIAKLEKRYPTGFNTADSLARRDVQPG